MIKDFTLHGAKQALQMLRTFRSGQDFAKEFPQTQKALVGASAANDLRAFFQNRTSGAGIWKWDHYFDIYDRHLRKFRGRPVRILEIGIYSGGSLDMWLNYFGPEAEVFGVDIEPACRRYERPGVRVFIGNQADRLFWNTFRSEVPALDVVIDDGGHEPHQQIATMEELLPHLMPGGVYICEDAHGVNSQFLHHVYGFATQMNDMSGFRDAPDNPDRRLVVSTNTVQSSVESISLYPFVVAIQMREQWAAELVAPKRGTEWEPFLA